MFKIRRKLFNQFFTSANSWWECQHSAQKSLEVHWIHQTCVVERRVESLIQCATKGLWKIGTKINLEFYQKLEKSFNFLRHLDIFRFLESTAIVRRSQYWFLSLGNYHILLFQDNSLQKSRQKTWCLFADSWLK